jgi:hypothetical protein
MKIKFLSLASIAPIPSLFFPSWNKKKYITLKFQNAQPIIIFFYTFFFIFSHFCNTKILKIKIIKRGRTDFFFVIFLLVSFFQEPKISCVKNVFFFLLDIRCQILVKGEGGQFYRPPWIITKFIFVEHTMRETHCIEISSANYAKSVAMIVVNLSLLDNASN